MLRDYEHHAKYYETDQMGCVHHSNFIRWMEEARIDMMEQMGCGYRSMEEAGILCPVLDVSCQYRAMVHFDDRILIRVRVKAYNGIRMNLSYEMRGRGNETLLAAGESSHCFLDRKGHPISLKRAYPAWDTAFIKTMESQDADPTERQI